MAQREHAIQSALQDLDSGVYTNLTAAARAYDIPRSTLQHRKEGKRNRRVAHLHQQRLTPEQEEFLVEWILDEDRRGDPPSHTRAREMATRVLKINGDIEPLGKN